MWSDWINDRIPEVGQVVQVEGYYTYASYMTFRDEGYVLDVLKETGAIELEGSSGEYKIFVRWRFWIDVEVELITVFERLHART